MLNQIWSFGFRDLTCVGITKDFQNFHVFGKNQTCVGITTDYLNFCVCGFIHTCVVFTTYLDLSKCLVKTTHVWKNPHMCVYFQIQGGCFCICICIGQISLKNLTFYIYLSFKGRRPNKIISEQVEKWQFISRVWEFPHT